MLTSNCRQIAKPIGLIGFVLVSLVLTLHPLSAQGVRGIAVEAESARPIEGAFVSVIDDSGQAVASTLTGPDGAYALHVYRAGLYRLRVERVGYATWTSDSFELTRGQTLSRRVDVPVQAIRLSELSVTVESRCKPRPGAGEWLAQVWKRRGKRWS